MNILLNEICSYLTYLNSDLDLSVSVHFPNKTLSAIPDDVFNKLLPFNIHKSPFCAHIKAKNWDKCITHQQNILSGNQQQRNFCLCCHAGINEYVHYFYLDNDIAGYIAVSGYRNRENLKDKTPHCEHLKTEPIPIKLLNTIIPPLARMFETFFSFGFENSYPNEYKLILQFLSERNGQATLDDVCKYFGRSKSYVSHLFNQENSQGFSAYCNHLKLSYAKKLIKKTPLTITEIALDAGFNDVSYFILQFKKTFGDTPLKYKKKCAAFNK